MKQRGYTLAGALVMIAVMSIMMMLAVELWSWVKRRENETELIFRGKEYMEAIARYHAKFNAYPPDLETLLKLKYIRKLYPDPMTKSGKWKVLHPDSLVQTGQAGTIVQTGGGKSNPAIKTGGDEDTFGNDKDKDQDEEPEVETTGPVVGVVSRSKKTSIKLFNNQTTYNKWVFAFALQPQQQQQPNGQPGNPNQGGKPVNPGANGNRPPQQNPPPNSFGNPPPPNPPDINNQDDDNDNQ